jgi:peptidoglycan L-alanyl-D-glutamate endopeptidase CwlK
MINSRSVDDLHPVVAAKCRLFLAKCSAAGIDVLVTSTYRDHASQDALYAQGRTAPGKKVTNAKGGESFHNWRVAFDVVPMRAGKPVWGTKGEDAELWRKIGSIGELVGFEWGGRWTKMLDWPHFQYTGGLTLKDFQAGRTLP